MKTPTPRAASFSLTAAAALVALLLPGGAARAQVVQATQMTVSVPTAGNNYSNGVLTRDGRSKANAFVDDAYLSTITFGSGASAVTFTSAGGNFARVKGAYVASRRDDVNAEFGDRDDARDNNANPFVRAGVLREGESLSDTLREGVTPATQDAAIAAAFNGGSLTEGVDGEAGDYSFNLTFENGIFDNAAGADLSPELIFFERGVNSDYSLRAIIGGTLTNPIFAANTVTVLRGSTWASGFWIDTIEIGEGQQLGVAGVDLTAFGVGAGQAVYGVQLTSLNGSGADLYGAFLSAANPNAQFSATPTALTAMPAPVPEPGAYVTVLSMAGMTGFGLLRGRRRAAGRKGA